MSTPLIIALACAFVALAYGLVSIRWILAQPAGNDRMQEIAAAIQAGAKAYLNRQYTTIAIVGAVLFVVLGFALDWYTAIGFLIGAVLSGSDRLHRHVHLGARQRAHGARPPTTASTRRSQVAFRGGAITGMLVVGLGLLGVAGYYAAILPMRR